LKKGRAFVPIVRISDFFIWLAIWALVLWIAITWPEATESLRRALRF
jgi:hypothetical protein